MSIRKRIPRDGTARCRQRRKRDFKEFVHRLNVFNKVLELGSERVEGVFENCAKVRLAMSNQVQLLLHGCSHSWLDEIHIDLQYIGVNIQLLICANFPHSAPSHSGRFGSDNGVRHIDKVKLRQTGECWDW